eukprot:TRINITY_DN3498_c0_g1_i1.p1 TRINITY_DN3498_c0_g1~~TRINITY_DN3498_c0_g1_i1.p1  ORF type:complete len:450 (-),score=51.51 TRINITY_DN3498_c0_g1_i1:33-1382(-)
MNQVGLKGLLITPVHKRSNYIELAQSLVPGIATMDAHNLACEQIPSLKHIIHSAKEHLPGFIRFQDVVINAEKAETVKQELANLLQQGSPKDPINIQFTSGTTGLPKGATLTNQGLLNNGFYIGERMRLTDADIVCIPVPLYHCFGLVLGVLSAITHGSRIVFPASSFDPLSVLQAVETEKCTTLLGVPTMFIAELEHPKFQEFNLSTLRTGIMAGSVCPIEIMKRVMTQMHMKEITICYGMTETSPVSFQTEPDSSVEQRVETVGCIHPHVECKIVDESGNTVPIGTPGELHTKGYLVMHGYWDDPVKTNECINSGHWMRTGDLAVMDADGYCRVVGRIKDMIIRGGENIYPREIEDYLLTMPGVKDASVFGVPDSKFGEQVAVWVKRKADNVGCELTAESIQNYCKGTIAHYKVPFYVLFKEDFPMTVTGKIKKCDMRQQTTAELAL